MWGRGNKGPEIVYCPVGMIPAPRLPPRQGSVWRAGAGRGARPGQGGWAAQPHPSFIDSRTQIHGGNQGDGTGISSSDSQRDHLDSWRRDDDQRQLHSRVHTILTLPIFPLSAFPPEPKNVHPEFASSRRAPCTPPPTSSREFRCQTPAPCLPQQPTTTPIHTTCLAKPSSSGATNMSNPHLAPRRMPSNAPSPPKLTPSPDHETNTPSDIPSMRLAARDPSSFTALPTSQVAVAQPS